jgi:hypothetical protein
MYARERIKEMFHEPKCGSDLKSLARRIWKLEYALTGK